MEKENKEQVIEQDVQNQSDACAVIIPTVDQPEVKRDYKPILEECTTSQSHSEPSIITQPAPVAKAIVESRPRDYLALSIFVCICCFWPLGMCALLHSLRTITLIGDGEIEEARTESKKTLILIIASGAVNISILFLLLILLTSY